MGTRVAPRLWEVLPQLKLNAHRTALTLPTPGRGHDLEELGPFVRAAVQLGRGQDGFVIPLADLLEALRHELRRGKAAELAKW